MSQKHELNDYPFKKAHRWLDDDHNRVSPDTVDGGIYIVGLVLAVLVLGTAFFGN